MNNVQKLETQVMNYAQTIGCVPIENNGDYRRVRKGLRLTYKLYGSGLSYYEWLCNERNIWARRKSNY